MKTRKVLLMDSYELLIRCENEFVIGLRGWELVIKQISWYVRITYNTYTRMLREFLGIVSCSYKHSIMSRLNLKLIIKRKMEIKIKTNKNSTRASH